MQRIREASKRWICGDEAKLRWSSMATLELHLGASIVNADGICESHLQSSPVLLRSASIRSASLKFSLIASPMLLLVVEGLRVEVISRTADDDFWKVDMLNRNEQARVKKLAAMDSEGVAEHARAEKLRNPRSSFVEFFLRMLLTFFISAIRIEFHDVKLSYPCESHRQKACLSAASLVSPEGLKNSVLKGSLLASASSCIARMKSPYSKPVTISELRLHFRKLNSNTGVELQDAQHAVLVMMVFLSLNFEQAEYRDLEVNAPEAVFGMDSCEADTVMAVVSQVQGPQYSDTRELVCTDQAYPRGRTAKELWTWAVTKAIQASPMQRLTQTLRACLLRRRYASLYSEWLQVMGWRSKRITAARPEALKRLSETILHIERQLPVEAVALLRQISRRKRLEGLEGEPVEISDKRSRFMTKLRSFSLFQAAETNDGEALQKGRRTANGFSVNIRQGSVSFLVSGSGACVRWTGGCVSYGNNGYSVTCGTLEGELLVSAEQEQVVSAQHRQCQGKGRWDEKKMKRFLLLSGSGCESQTQQQAGRLIGKHSPNMQSTHIAAEQRETELWLEKFLHGGDICSRKPFLIATYDDPSEDVVNELNSTSSAVLAAGTLELFLSCSVLLQTVPLVSYLKGFQKVEQSSSATRERTSTGTRNFILDKVQVSQYMSGWRSILFSLVPDRPVQVSAIIQSLSLCLSASDHPPSGVISSTVHMGLLELALWPASMEQTIPNEKWVKQPPLPVLPSLDGFSEHEQLGCNFVIGLEGAAIGCLRQNSNIEQLVEPFTVTAELSSCRDQFRSLFNTFETVSLSATVAIPSLMLDLTLEKLSAFHAFASLCVDAFSQILSTHAANIAESSERAESSEDGGDVTSTQETQHFVLWLDVTLEDVKGVIGNEPDGSALFAVGSTWLHSTLGDGVLSSICSGLRNVELKLLVEDDATAATGERPSLVSMDHMAMVFCDNSTGLERREPTEGQRTGQLGSHSGNVECFLELDIGTVIFANCQVENLLARARSCPSTTVSMRVLLAVEKDTRKCVFELEGGIVLVHAVTLAAVISLAQKYVLPESSSLEEGDEERAELSRSYSAPDQGQATQDHVPVRWQSTPEILDIRSDDVFEGIISGKVSGASLIIAAAEGSEGVLVELNGSSAVELQRSSCKVMAEVTQCSILTLPQPQPEMSRTPAYRIPEFGRHEDSGTNLEGSPSGVRSAFESSRLDYILECLTISSSLSKTSSMNTNLEDCWHGRLAVTGCELALTTHELQMLISSLLPLSSISSGGKTLQTAEKRSSYELERHACSSEPPDGAIVSIKDAQEHLYLSVEETPAAEHRYHLGGVWHHSIAGERALFQVKYQDGTRDPMKWFSLLSLHAKSSDGVPLRVHYRPGSRQVEISSINDGSWELWQCVPYRAEGTSEFDVYSGIFGNLVHITNQKSKQGLAFVDGVPTFTRYPGNTFKIQVMSRPATGDVPADADSQLARTTTVPRISFDMGPASLTLLHEAAGAEHLLPLIRMRVEDLQGLMQGSSCKTRIIAACNIVLEHFEAQSSSWLSIINPVGADFIWSSRVGTPGSCNKKIPASLFCRLKKVDIVVSELSLDACLFLIGIMDLAGPFTVNHSPVLVNRCQIENQTGVNLLCHFDRETGEEEGKIAPWQSSSYLMRHVTSRRGATPAEVSTAVTINLEKPGKGLSSPITLSLGEPGVLALRPRLEALEGSRPDSPGPIVVFDISKQSQDGIHVAVSPMVKIHNATGLPLQLRCRRSKQGDERGAIVSLKNGDIIDDSMGSFDALSLEGEMKKALLSFNVGNFFLSVRPDEGTYEWSDDVKGAKAVRVTGLFEKLHYSFKRTLKSKSLDYSFGSVSCKTSAENVAERRLHFLIRTSRRQVPVTKIGADHKRSLVAWQEQQEMLILPTLRVSNFISSTVYVQVMTKADGKNKVVDEATISGLQGRASLYADLSALSLVLKDMDHDLVSDPIDISTGHRRYQELAKNGGSIRDLDIDVDFKDGIHMALLKVYRADDGVLELSIFTKYCLRNDSQVPVVCCVMKKLPKWGGKRTRSLQWPASASTINLAPNSTASWIYKSNNLLLKRDEERAQPAALDLDALSGSLEISLGIQTISTVDKVQLGVTLQVPYQAGPSPAHIVCFSPRYTVTNESSKTICVCQDGFEDDERSVEITPGGKVAVHAQVVEGQDEGTSMGMEKESHTSSLSLRFRFKETGWRWSGCICAASLGSFFLKLRCHDGQMQFAILSVEERAASLAIKFRLHTSEALPYRIENKLQSGSISFHQMEVTESETLLPKSFVGFAWDDLSLQHRLVVSLSGPVQAIAEVNLDKIKAWKSFAAAHRSKGFSLQLPFQGQLGASRDQPDDLLEKGYEVYADGPTRVLRVCEKVHSTKKSYWQSEMSLPKQKVELKIPIFRIFMIETQKQKIEDLTGEDLSGSSSAFSPFLCAVLTSISTEALVTVEHTFCQFRVQGLGLDIKWQGAPFAAMLRLHDQDRLNKTTTALHGAVVLSNTATNPIQVKYSSLLLQAFDLNIDEDTLLRLVPFYRTSLSTASSSRQIYFERFEIHPIKIVASFLPGHPRADYTSAQETFRALLHTVIKLPSVRGATVELNGVLLSHALLTFRQLMMKCVQHYSWYSMRAIYIARGSKLLPPGFASLFDDSAASSLDVFFDPSSGSIDLQGLTLGMFNLLSRGLRKKGQGGTSRYLGDLEKTVKKAGSNLVFAVVTELSDNVLKGAEANGFDGMINGFRRGILNVAMEPRVLQKAVVRGGSTRRIQLDRSVGTDEAYIEGYLQATLDALFKQDYLKVKVMEDQVVLKNLPPNSMLMNDIVTCVRNFLIGEGLLAGEASSAAVRSLRLLRGEQEQKLIPAVISLGEQLLVIFAIRGLRQYTRDVFHIPGSWGRFSRTGADAAVPAATATGAAATAAAAAATAAAAAAAAAAAGSERPSLKRTVGNFFISSAVAYIDGRLCRHIPNELARRIVSGFLLSFVE